ncbi:MAG: sugar phosphate nucleotidyltransferase [Planctomycetota bacterium]
MRSFNPDNIAVLILAGGSGKRLWPYVSKDNPKFIFAPFGKTILENTICLAKEIVPPQHIFILTTLNQKKFLSDIVPSNLQNNIITEPATRDTAFALIFGAFKIFQKMGPVFLLNLATDHIIEKVDEFKRGLKFATYHKEYLYLFTTPIQFPSIHHGYVKVGKRLSGLIYKVERFIEKPPEILTKKFMKNTSYRWNCGIFFWHFKTFSAECKKIKPLFKFLYYIANNNPQKAYSLPSPGSIEFSLLEKTNILATLNVNIRWHDIGTWENLLTFTQTKKKNIEDKILSTYNAKNIRIFGDFTKVKVIGVDDLLIVKSKNNLLISRYGKSFHLKNLN